MQRDADLFVFFASPQALVFFSLVGVMMTVVSAGALESLSRTWRDVLIALAIYSYGFAAAVVVAMAAGNRKKKKKRTGEEEGADPTVSGNGEWRLPTYEEVVVQQEMGVVERNKGGLVK